MDAKAAEGLTKALWSIHKMLSELNCGNKIDAEEVDKLEEQIVLVEDHLEWEWK